MTRRMNFARIVVAKEKEKKKKKNIRIGADEISLTNHRDGWVNWHGRMLVEN